MIKIYSYFVSPRLEYICRLVFNHLLGVDYEITDKTEEYIEWKGTKINYSKDRIYENDFLIIPLGLLSEKTIHEFEPEVAFLSDIPVLFPANGDADIRFDIFSATFYMVSRYEEYLGFRSDKLGRFTSMSGIAGKYGFVEKPVVNLWVEIFSNKLLQKFPSLVFIKPKFQSFLTIDIDNAYAIRHKGILRALGSMYKSLAEFEIVDFLYKFLVHMRLKADPYDTYHYIHKAVKENHLQIVMFFLLGTRSKYDKNLSTDNIHYIHLIEREAKLFSVGIHPSYNSNLSCEKVSREINILHKIIKRKVKRSRQHYLKLSFPTTYKSLLNEGIEEDFTMGFHDRSGFRAGIANPFFFYDLSVEAETKLKIIPFQIMDATLNHYLKQNPSQAIEKIYEMISIVRKVNGTFVAIWHNESLSDWHEWKGWLQVFNALVTSLKKKNGN